MRIVPGIFCFLSFICRLLPAPINVCATVPELGSLVREVGGQEVVLNVFVSPRDNPHQLEARPGFIKAANQAQLVALIGMELEVAYLPAILANARNASIMPGKPGYFDASQFVKPRDVPVGVVDRSMGDIHPSGNPHYLMDPINGLVVAGALRDRLSELSPEQAPVFEVNFKAFEKKILTSLVGDELAQKYDVYKLARLMELGKLHDFLEERKELDSLLGWFGDLRTLRGQRLIEDHKLYAYFAARFGFQILNQLEPRPGIQPGFKHLTQIISQSKQIGIKHIMVSSFFPVKLVNFLKQNSNFKIIQMEHQLGSRGISDSYHSWIDYNVMALKKGL